MSPPILLSLIVAVEFYLAAPALADHTIVLKNGRRMTVQSHREEGPTIKVPALCGELGIPTSKTILKSGQTAGQGLVISELVSPNRESQSLQKPAPSSSINNKDAPLPNDVTPEANAEEAKDYKTWRAHAKA